MNDHVLGDNSLYSQRHFSCSQSVIQLPFTVAAQNSIDPIRVHSSTRSTTTSSATVVSTKTGHQRFIQVSSSNGEGSYQRSLTKNTSPRIIHNSGLQIGKGSEINLDRNLLQAVDTEQHASQLIYRLTQSPQNGALLLKGIVLKVGDRFTQADINSGLVSYRSVSGVTQFTDNSSPKQLKGFAGQNIVWEGFDGNDWEIFIHNIVTNTTTQLTHNAFNDKVLGISGSNIVWSRSLSKPVGNENELLKATGNELLWFNGKTISHITHDGAIHNDLIAIDGSNIFWESTFDTSRYSSQEFSFTNGKVRKRLTNHSQYKYVQAVQGAKIVWGSIGDPQGKETFPAQELFLFNGKTTTRLTHNRVDDSLARIDTPYIAWSSDIGPKIRKWRSPKRTTTEIMLFNGKTTRRLTRNRIDDTVIGMDGSHVVYQEGGFWQDDYPDLFLFDGKRQIQLTNNKIPNRLVSIDGSNVFWTSELNPFREPRACHQLSQITEAAR
ncbi:MAG TPA: cadherin-like domain-containing protein [Crinalium sp.]